MADGTRADATHLNLVEVCVAARSSAHHLLRRPRAAMRRTAALGSFGARCDMRAVRQPDALCEDRKSTRLNSSHSQISYAVFCLKKKNSSNRLAGGVT